MNINKQYLSKVNTYSEKNEPKYIVIHETDNWKKGANALAHAKAQARGNLNTSVHYYCGSDGVYQVAEHCDGTYSIGFEYGGSHEVTDANNRNSINIEICVNADGDYAVAREYAIKLVKELMEFTGITAGRVIRHYDAKGKHCPRNMMDNPELWKDFKAQIGTTEVFIDKVENGKVECWYRVGSDWIDGICQNQTGAYRNLENAINDCKVGQNVYAENGTVIYIGNSVSIHEKNYSLREFVEEVQSVTGSEVDGYAGEETIGNTPTVSRTVNKNHPVVTALERRLKALGYYTGKIEADEGNTPIFGKGMEEAVNAYQQDKFGTHDGEITAKKRTWRLLLGMM